MRKILTISLTLLLLPFSVLAADELTFDADTTITVNGENLTVVSGSIVDQMVVSESSVVFSLSTNSSIVIRSANRRVLDNNLTDYICGSSYSQISVSGNSLGSSLGVSPSSEVCVSITGGAPITTTSSGGGGGVTAPSKPTTATGEVTATAAAGGKTTLTVSNGNTASVDLPIGAVSASTAVKVNSENKIDVIASRPLPSKRTVVGDNVYNYTAAANSVTISSFSKTVTLTFTYKDNEVNGLDESTLKIFYWKESTSQWVALTTVIDSTNNNLTATTDHFTYFAIMGLTAGETATGEVTEGETTAASREPVIFDGDLVRNPNAADMAQFDIYIVKMIGGKKFRRLILSPHVFESYAHFDKNGNGSPWDDVKDISQSAMSEYTTSSLVRAVGDAKVYQLLAEEGSDTGIKQWLNMTATQFLAGHDADSIYEINVVDRNAYASGTDI
ncbi:hypothetical protein KKD72_01630 [Patescibacteria group bacterium]|nr:hypothetical protein [Patescibacteria group bacterium]